MTENTQLNKSNFLDSQIILLTKSLIDDLAICKTELVKNFISQALKKSIDTIVNNAESLVLSNVQAVDNLENEKLKLEADIKKLTNKPFVYKHSKELGISDIELNEYRDINGINRKEYYDCAKECGHDCVAYEKGLPFTPTYNKIDSKKLTSLASENALKLDNSEKKPKKRKSSKKTNKISKNKEKENENNSIEK